MKNHFWESQIETSN